MYCEGRATRTSFLLALLPGIRVSGPKGEAQYRRYQRMATTITSGGNQNPANAEVAGNHERERVDDFTAQACDRSCQQPTQQSFSTVPP